MKRTWSYGAAVMTLCLLTGCSSRVEKGVSYLEEGSYTEAIAQFQDSIQKEKDLAEAYRGIGIAQFELGRYEEAQQALEEALQEGATETVSIYHLLSTCCLQLERWEEALHYCQKGLEMTDASEEVQQEMKFNIVGIYEKLGDWEAARTAVEDYLEFYPDDENAQKEAEFLETR